MAKLTKSDIDKLHTRSGQRGRLSDPHKKQARSIITNMWKDRLVAIGAMPKSVLSETVHETLKRKRRDSSWQMVAAKQTGPLLNRRGALRSPVREDYVHRKITADEFVTVEGLMTYAYVPKNHLPGGKFVAIVTGDSTHQTEVEPQVEDYREQE